MVNGWVIHIVTSQSPFAGFWPALLCQRALAVVALSPIGLKKICARQAQRLGHAPCTHNRQCLVDV